MVVGAFPIAKLSVLLIKQISKPIANICKERAKSHPFFRTYVCMPPAQFYNWCEVKAKMWILNLGKPVNIPVLSQEMAIELGANLLGETVIFVIGAGLLLFEYNRQSKKETAKELKREEEMNHITSTITELYFTVQQQQTQMREMERLIHSISGKKPSTPPPTPRGAPQSPAPPPVAPSAPAPAHPPTPRNINQMDPYYENVNVLSTPYPDKGIILQSLNYIQMDVLSSIFPQNNSTKEHPHEEQQQQKPHVAQTKSQQQIQNAVLTEALYNIENNFRSLF